MLAMFVPLYVLYEVSIVARPLRAAEEGGRARR